MSISGPLESLETPLALPRYTFLIGGDWKQNFDFAKLLQKENEEVVIYDMRQPLYEAASLLFLDSFDAVPDLEMQRFAEAKLPPLVNLEGGNSLITTAAWLAAFEQFLVESIGSPILGLLAKTRIGEDNGAVVFLGASFSNIAPLVEPDSIVACCGELKTPPTGTQGRFIWFPQPSTTERYAQLKREIGTL